MLKIAVTAIVGVFLLLLVKQYRPEYTLLIRLSVTGIIVFSALKIIGDMLPEIETMLEGAGIESAYLRLLTKVLGVSVVTQLAADTCRDSGEGTIAAKVELAGKIIVLSMCLPLAKTLLQLSTGMITG